VAVTLANLVQRCRDRVDLNDSTHVTDAELEQWLKDANEELNELCAEYDPSYFQGSDDFTLSGASSEADASWSMTATSAVRKITSVVKDPDTSSRRELERWDRANEGQLTEPAYRLDGKKIIIAPYELSAGNYRLYYVGLSTGPMSAGVDLDPWLERFAGYLVIRACISARDKEESDTSTLIWELERWKERIRKALVRDTNRPPVVPDPEGNLLHRDWLLP
jgi:hypothetical protein